jgi:hypothetical protein
VAPGIINSILKIDWSLSLHLHPHFRIKHLRISSPKEANVSAIFAGRFIRQKRGTGFVGTIWKFTFVRGATPLLLLDPSVAKSMGKPSRASQAKKGRERAKQEKQQEKRELRVQRKEQKKLLQAEGGDCNSQMDPDLEGIYPGPQPLLVH